MSDYWSIAQRHLAEMRARRALGPADPVDPAVPVPASPPPADPTDAAIAAVRMISPVIGSYWIIADDNEMTPDILAAGLPVFRFAEVPFLRGLGADDLRAVAAVKRVFPTSTVIQ